MGGNGGRKHTAGASDKPLLLLGLVGVRGGGVGCRGVCWGRVAGGGLGLVDLLEEGEGRLLRLGDLGLDLLGGDARRVALGLDRKSVV